MAKKSKINWLSLADCMEIAVMVKTGRTAIHPFRADSMREILKKRKNESFVDAALRNFKENVTHLASERKDIREKLGIGAEDNIATALDWFILKQKLKALDIPSKIFWKPMRTAPKNGKRILLLDTYKERDGFVREPIVGFWHELPLIKQEANTMNIPILNWFPRFWKTLIDTWLEDNRHRFTGEKWKRKLGTRGKHRGRHNGAFGGRDKR